jgi:hypothetical protein
MRMMLLGAPSGSVPFTFFSSTVLAAPISRTSSAWSSWTSTCVFWDGPQHATLPVSTKKKTARTFSAFSRSHESKFTAGYPPPSWPSKNHAASTRAAMSSTRPSGTVPFATYAVRFAPKYESPEEKVTSPGMVMSSPARAESVECVACQSDWTSVRVVVVGYVSVGRARGGMDAQPRKPYSRLSTSFSILSFSHAYVPLTRSS